MDSFVFWPAKDRERQFEIFAQEVVPAVRAALGQTAAATSPEAPAPDQDLPVIDKE